MMKSAKFTPVSDSNKQILGLLIKIERESQGFVTKRMYSRSKSGTNLFCINSSSVGSRANYKR